jgi:hypothetical protein
MELDPKYATVIVKRFIEHAGTDQEVFLLREGKKIPYGDVPKPDIVTEAIL